MSSAGSYLHALAVLTGKRIANNWQLVAALFVGVLLAASIAAAVPIYAAGSLQDSFLSQWTDVDAFRPPFTLILSHKSTDVPSDVPGRITDADLRGLREELTSSVPDRVGLPAASHAVYARLGGRPFTAPTVTDPPLTAPRADVAHLSNLREVADIVDGRWYDSQRTDAVEAVVDEATFENLEITVGETFNYFVPVPGGRRVIVPVTVVGFFQAKPGTTTADWIYPPPFHRVLFVDPAVFHEYFLSRLEAEARQYDLFWVFDYRSIAAHELQGLIRDLESVEARAASLVPGTEFWLSPLPFFRDFHERMVQVRTFIFVLAVPTLALSLYYVALMAALSFRRRETEMIVLLSRGAGRVQIVVSFLLEWLVVCGVAFAAAPAIGMIGARALGSSTGFLSFVNRRAVSTSLMPEAWWFAAAAAATGLIAGMAPTLSTFRYSIVTFKQERASGKRPLWNRVYLDVILIAVAAFGYRDLSLQSRAIESDALLSGDPVFFLVPFVAMFGVGLFCLRVFPAAAGLVHLISNRFRGVVVQLTARELHRNARHYAPLILLIILTVAVGIYSASTARTLGENFEDQIYYRVGADIAVEELWSPPPTDGGIAAPTRPASEPPFLSRLEFPGVRSAARVLRERVNVTADGRNLGRGELMAVVPREFAETAWFRRDLAPSHFYDYLSLLNRHPGGAIVSEPAAAAVGLELGDPVSFSYADQTIEVYVAAVIPFWPTMDPQEDPFIIANLGYVQSYVRIEPYQVWYEVTDEANVQDIVDHSLSLGVYVQDYDDARTELRNLRREPYRMGFFGMLSMGFIVSGLVTTLGIFAYSLFSMRNRRIQFGSLRALGLSTSQLFSIIGLEHFAGFAFGLLGGLGVGLGAVRLFLPFLRDRAQELQAVPPFRIVVESADLVRLLIVVGVVFAATVVALVAILRRIRLGEAIRLGEEA